MSLVASGQLQFNQVSAEQSRLHKEKCQVRVIAPTPTCVDDWERGQAWPPRADDADSQMVRADHVVNPIDEERVLWPSYYVRPWHERQREPRTYEKYLSDTLCRRGRESDVDRDRGFFTTDSPSAAAIQAAERDRVEIISTLKPEFDLRTEDRAALQAQCDRYLQ